MSAGNEGDPRARRPADTTDVRPPAAVHAPDPRGAEKRLVARLDRAALVGLGVGVAILLQPWWSEGLRVGFFFTLACTLSGIVLAHWPEKRA